MTSINSLGPIDPEISKFESIKKTKHSTPARPSTKKAQKILKEKNKNEHVTLKNLNEKKLTLLPEVEKKYHNLLSSSSADSEDSGEGTTDKSITNTSNDEISRLEATVEVDEGSLSEESLSVLDQASNTLKEFTASRDYILEDNENYTPPREERFTLKRQSHVEVFDHGNLSDNDLEIERIKNNYLILAEEKQDKESNHDESDFIADLDISVNTVSTDDVIEDLTGKCEQIVADLDKVGMSEEDKDIIIKFIRKKRGAKEPLQRQNAQREFVTPTITLEHRTCVVSQNANEMRENFGDTALFIAEKVIHALGESQGALEGAKLFVPAAIIPALIVFMGLDALKLRNTRSNQFLAKTIQSTIAESKNLDKNLSLDNLSTNFEDCLKKTRKSRSPTLAMLAKTMKYIDNKFESKAIKLDITLMGGLIEIGGALAMMALAPTGYGAVPAGGITATGFTIQGLPLVFRIGKCAYKIFQGTKGVNREKHARFLYGLALYALEANCKALFNLPEAEKTLKFIEGLNPLKHVYGLHNIHIHTEKPEFEEASKLVLQFLIDSKVLVLPPEDDPQYRIKVHEFCTVGLEKIMNFMKST